MGKIKILSAEVAGRIAAGEVIERPASVVKELVENSIDAGSTRIRVNVEDGGHRLIQVIDNGCGMDREDALLCLEAHATSKLTPTGDVGQIHTLGFRGEALPSISSVSHFQLQTRLHGDLAGTEVLITNGVIENVGDCGCAEGTNIKVGYLFGNLPARRKFLKGAASEEAYIEETMLLLALSRPDISFELFFNKRQVFRLPASVDIATRAAMLTGKEAFASMLPVDYHEDSVHVYGYISRPGFTRNTRREQRVIINGRAAAAETVFFAIRNAYDTLVLKGRYPSTLLYIDLSAERVDVNVHPAKREVRFREPLKISGIIGAALRAALRELPGGEDASSYGVSSARPVQTESMRLTALPSQPAPACASEAPSTLQRPSASAPPPSISRPQRQLPLQPPGPPVPTSSASLSAPEKDATPSPSAAQGLRFTLLAPLGDTYLLAESGTGLVVINVKAASRRILFERILENMKSQHIVQQQLLLPVTLNLPPQDAKFLSSRLEDFRRLGFSIEPFGGHTFLVTAAPAFYPDRDLQETLKDILSDFRDNSSGERETLVRLAQISANRVSASIFPKTDGEQRQLIQDLLRCEMPYTCPLGLPTMIHITHAELAKRFGK